MDLNWRSLTLGSAGVLLCVATIFWQPQSSQALSPSNHYWANRQATQEGEGLAVKSLIDQVASTPLGLHQPYPSFPLSSREKLKPWLALFGEIQWNSDETVELDSIFVAFTPEPAMQTLQLDQTPAVTIAYHPPPLSQQPLSSEPDDIGYYLDIIEQLSLQYQVPSTLLEAIVWQESGFQAHALSSQGAQGLMQLMPQTALELGVDNPWDPRQNLDGGTRYLIQQWERFGRLDLALAAYNAGPQAVERWQGIPPYPETTQYVDQILSRYEQSGTNRGSIKISTNVAGF